MPSRRFRALTAAVTTADHWRRWLAELLGTAALLAAIVGSGVVAGRLGGDTYLFDHAVVVGGALFVLISVFGPVSGAHFNPAVTLAAWICRLIDGSGTIAYLVMQLLGAVLGVMVAHAMFGLEVVAFGATPRTGVGIGLSEAAATAGLVFVIFALLRSGQQRLIAVAVGVFIAGAVFASASTAFANPAVTVARMLTDTWTGIRPVDVPWFVVSQLAGMAGGLTLAIWMFSAPPPLRSDNDD